LFGYGFYWIIDGREEGMNMGILDNIKGWIGLGPRMTFAGVPRSPEWPRVRKNHIVLYPTCAVCGGKNNLEVHHIMPFHLDKSKELDPENLITLCTSKSHNDHLIFGHFLDFTRYSNANVREDAMNYNNKLNKERIGIIIG
jgi:hypothetical protein